MKVFISWSGEHSRAVAQALSKLIKVVIQSAKPWVSTKEIQAGDRWSMVIANGLLDAQFGIICVTPTNQSSPWLNFEAGAISKNVDESRIVPYLHGLTFPNMESGPLSQFQAKESNKEDTFEVLSSINSVLPSPLDIDTLEEAFNSYWSTFENTLNNIDLTPNDESLSKRSPESKLDELIEIVKGRDYLKDSKLDYIATNLKYIPILLRQGSVSTTADNLLPTFLNLLSMQQRAFVRAAKIRIEPDSRTLYLEYDNKKLFHYKQAKRIEDSLRDTLAIIADGRYRLAIINTDIPPFNDDDIEDFEVS